MRTERVGAAGEVKNRSNGQSLNSNRNSEGVTGNWAGEEARARAGAGGRGLAGSCHFNANSRVALCPVSVGKLFAVRPTPAAAASHK